MDIGFDYKITQPGVVMDVGAYNGDFIDYIRPKYQCGVHAFEPSKEKFAALIKKYAYDPLIWPYNVALEDEDCQRILYGENDGRSLYGHTEDGEVVKVRDIWGFITSFKFPKIDILKLNCEGSEYKIIQRLFDKEKLKDVVNLVVQWHFFFPGAEVHYNDLVEKLKLTHERQFYCQTSHWEWWVRK